MRVAVTLALVVLLAVSAATVGAGESVSGTLEIGTAASFIGEGDSLVNHHRDDHEIGGNHDGNNGRDKDDEDDEEEEWDDDAEDDEEPEESDDESDDDESETDTTDTVQTDSDEQTTSADDVSPLATTTNPPQEETIATTERPTTRETATPTTRTTTASDPTTTTNEPKKKKAEAQTESVSEPTTTGEATSTQPTTASSTAVRVTGVEADKTNPVAGEPVTVTVTVENTKLQATDYTVRLWLFGEVVNARTVTLAPGESRTVSFVHAIEVPGEYEASSGGVSETISVTDRPEAAQPPVESGGVPGLGLLVGLLALIAVGLLRRVW